MASVRAENGTRDLQSKMLEVLTVQWRRSVNSYKIINLDSTAR
jgi:hypothetical protein